MRIELFGLLLVATTAFCGLLPSFSDIAKSASDVVENGLSSIPNIAGVSPPNPPNVNSISKDVIKIEDEIVKIARNPKPEAIFDNLKKLILKVLGDHQCSSKKHSNESEDKSSDSSDESNSESNKSGKGRKRRDASNNPKDLLQESGLADLLKQIPQGDLCKLLSGLNLRQLGEIPKIPPLKDISQLPGDIKKVIERARNLTKNVLGGLEESDLPSVIQKAVEKALKCSNPAGAIIDVLSRIVKSYFEAMESGNPQLSFGLEVLKDGLELVTEIIKVVIKVGSEHGPELIGKGAAAAVATAGELASSAGRLIG